MFLCLCFFSWEKLTFYTYPHTLMLLMVMHVKYDTVRSLTQTLALTSQQAINKLLYVCVCKNAFFFIIDFTYTTHCVHTCTQNIALNKRPICWAIYRKSVLFFRSSNITKRVFAFLSASSWRPAHLFQTHENIRITRESFDNLIRVSLLHNSVRLLLLYVALCTSSPIQDMFRCLHPLLFSSSLARNTR